MKELKSAIIVELRGSYAAALREDGVFVRIHNAGYEIGETVSLEQDELPVQNVQLKRRGARLRAYAGVAAGFLLLLFGGWKGYTTPVGVVSLDVNPSIEYSINYFDKVLDITAVNDDAASILAGLDETSLRYRSVDEAVEQTILALRENGYLAETTENDVVISASSYSARHTEQIADRLSQRVGRQTDLTVYSVAVSRGEVQSAHALGASAGKLHIVERLGESWEEDTSFDPQDWLERPVRDIIRETREQANGKKPNQADSKATTEGQMDAVTGGEKQTQGQQSQQTQPDTTPKPQPTGGMNQDSPRQGETKSGGKGP
ncbi:MAG: hypothetical protein PHW41_05050 [Eubacteriales bacterium]|nr:hypothetical protein [Eubacteriales bacterium]